MLFPSFPVPTPSIIVSNTGIVYAGTPLTLTCDYTPSSPDTAVAWLVNGRAIDTSSDRVSIDRATLSFSPVATSDSGRYTCQLSVNASQVHVTVGRPRQTTRDIIVQSNLLISFIMPCMLSSFLSPVPQPNVDVTLSRTAPLYTGGSLTLTCAVTLDPNVDNGEIVVTEWSGPRDILGERELVTPASGSGTTYTGSLTIRPLADQDDGTYTCTVTVTGGNNNQATANDAIEILVMSK